MLAWLRIAAMGIFGYFVPRILVGAGVPLDEWAAALGQLLGAPTPWMEEWGLTIIGLAVGAILSGIEVWWHPAQRIWRKIFNNTASNDKDDAPDFLNDHSSTAHGLLLSAEEIENVTAVTFPLDCQNYSYFRLVIDDLVPEKSWADLWLIVSVEETDDLTHHARGKRDYTYTYAGHAEVEDSKIVLAEGILPNRTRPVKGELHFYSFCEHRDERKVEFSCRWFHTTKSYATREGYATFKGSYKPVKRVSLLCNNGLIKWANMYLYGHK